MNTIVGILVRSLTWSIVLLFSIATLLISCSDSSTESKSDNDPALIGTWSLTSVNGQPVAEGVYLRWTFTAETVTVTSDMDCVEVLRYSSANNVLQSLSVVSREGSQCGDDEGTGELGTYSVGGNILTLTMTDPDIDPPTAVFVFTKLN